MMSSDEHDERNQKSNAFKMQPTDLKWIRVEIETFEIKNTGDDVDIKAKLESLPN